MKRLFAQPSVQIALCLAVFAFIGYKLGPFALVVSSPLLGAAIAYPLYKLVAETYHGLRAHVWLPEHGQRYVFKGITIHVVEDDDHCRWISLADVRKVMGTVAGESALAATYPGRFQRMGEPEQPRLRDDALIEHLGKDNNPLALRWRTWVERTVANPGRNVRRQRGIRAEPPDGG